MEERLWDYIDGLSSPTERSAIEALIAENREWQEKYRELLNVHQLLDTSEMEAPSMRFTKNVMEEISRYHVAPATKTYINKNIIRSIGAFFLAMITGLLVFVFGQIKWSGANSDAATPYNNFVNSAGNIGAEKLNGLKTFNSSWTIAFMLVVIVLGWVLLDMYLTQKKERAGTQA
jgi:hypothetical protein